MVELYVRPLTKKERYMYGLTDIQIKEFRRINSKKPKDNNRSNNKVENRTHGISRTDLQRWQDKLQGD